MKRSKNKYREDNDPIRAFAEENLEITKNYKNHHIKTQLVYDDYKNWSKRNGYRDYETKKIFTKALKRLGVKVKVKTLDYKSARYYLGVKYN